MQSAPLRDDSDNVLRASENFTTLRLRRKFYNPQSFVGLMATNRRVDNNTNTGLGKDMLLNSSGDHYLIGAFANTIDSDKPVLASASRFNIRYEMRKTDGFFGDMSYTYSGREFNPQSGFLDRSDFQQWKGNWSWGKFATDKTSRYQYKTWNILLILTEVLQTKYGNR